MSDRFCPKCKKKFGKDYEGNACQKCLVPLQKETAQSDEEILAPYHTIDPKIGWVPHNIEQLEIKLVLEKPALRKIYEDVIEHKLKIQKREAKDKIKAIREVDKTEGKEEDADLGSEEDFDKDDY